MSYNRPKVGGLPTRTTHLTMCYWLLQAPFIATHRTWNGALNLKCLLLCLMCLIMSAPAGRRYWHENTTLQCSLHNSNSMAGFHLRLPLSTSLSIKSCKTSIPYLNAHEERASKETCSVMLLILQFQRSGIQKLSLTIKLFNSHGKCILH